MQDNKFSFSQKKHEETNQDYLKILQEENHRLRVENAELKRSLEKEEFLHKNLYKQWTELNARVSSKDLELRRVESKGSFPSKFFKYSFYILLLVVIAFTFYFFSKEDRSLALSQTLNIKDSVKPATAQVREQQISPVKDTKPEGKETIPSRAGKVSGNKTATPETGKIFNKYRVKTKTFFYNKPDESTRRNTFLLPYKGSYGIITPLDDQSGFIYIVFTNHAGRTSKGWIRKIDLDPVN